MRSTIWAVALVTATMLATPGAAQTAAGGLDLRVGKLEKEMKAVQRTVFPGGVPIQPEIAGSPGLSAAAGAPASTPVADLTARIDALEKGLAALTGQVEQTGYRGRQADDAVKRIEARLATLESKGMASTAEGPAAAGKAPLAARPGTAMSLRHPASTDEEGPVSMAPRNTGASLPVPSAKAQAAHKAAVAAIEMPSTGDAAEDDYTYGFRLYAAKLYPEAETKLKEFVAKYPAHRRASYAQNLLGRAYFDEGKPALASVAFYDNYQKLPKGERAPESLYWLGQALTKLKKLPDACKVYDELRDVYGAKLGADLKAKAARGRADAKCAA